MLPGEQFNVTSSFVMSEDGEPDAIIYYAFDYVKSSLGRSYALRMADLEALTVPKTKVLKLLPVTIHDEKELLQYEERCLKDGYEGVMLRSADGPYKCGRSTEREGYLLKLKRFEDSEAVIVGFEEKQHNGNLAIKDAFGRTERSSHKANLSPMGTLGALIVRDVKTNIEFNIGTGYDDIDRDHLWSQRDKLVGKLVKYKFQPTGIVERPRFPVYLGLRHLDDL
jgi:DNA ligase-1